MTLAEYLRSTETKAVEFAARVGVDKSTVSRWLDGDMIPRREIMKRISEITGGQVTANDFIEEREIIPNPNGSSAGGVSKGAAAAE